MEQRVGVVVGAGARPDPNRLAGIGPEPERVGNEVVHLHLAV